MSPPAATYTLHGVSKAYAGQQALQPIDLTIASGRTTVLLGPSGCGKTTLLRLLAGLTSSDGGSLHYHQSPIPVTADARRRYCQQLGYVIQEGGLFPHLSASDNITLAARHQGWDSDRIHQRVAELTDLVGLTPALLQRYPAAMSGGQRQRVALMRALMLDPDVLLLDEPLGALDPMIRYELQQQLKTIFSQLNKTVVLVTHDLAEAAWFGHWLVLMRAGAIVQQGSLDDMLQRPAEAFVGEFIRAQRGLSLAANT
ncbi:MAG: ATP-binding cassette domain-containing protein [Wenzhouxiangellaceae bacterium]